MIVKDEAARLRELLPRLRPHVNEIVIGDTGSSDESLKLAEESGARCFPVDFSGGFAEARNQVLSQAKQPWILQLDADEALHDSAFQKLRALAQQEPAAYEFEHRHYSDESDFPGFCLHQGSTDGLAAGAGYLRTFCFRFFPATLRYRGRVHESVEESARQAGVPLRSSGLVIHHYGHLDAERRQLRHALYLELGRVKVIEEPENWKAWFELGLAEARAGSRSLARAALERAYTLAPHEPLVAENFALISALTGDEKRARAVWETLVHVGKGSFNARSVR